MNKPREFWVYEDNGDVWVSEVNWNDQKPTGLHVIEYSAYEELQLQLNAAHPLPMVMRAHLETDLEAIRKERDEYRAALKKIATSGDGCEDYVAKEVLAKYPPKESK